MKKTFLLAAFGILFSLKIYGQKTAHVPGEAIVQVAPGVTVRQLEARLLADGFPVFFEKEISPPLRIWLLRFDYSQINEYHLLDELRGRSGVEVAQFNHRVELRSTVPDDPNFTDQWYWTNTGQGGGLANSDVDADLAWDITTGGATLTGQEIVVCVMEGANREHPDLQGNLWVNEAEIPDNGQDDDGNGYTDDFEGWNVSTETDFINPEGHGTSVSGVIGAKGNNGLLLTGLNWDVKIMHVDFANATESSIIAAYTYPFVMRKKYNETGGLTGALVVATNASWGFDEGDPADFPLWCSFYDSLGSVGILNCVATTNENANVDVVGDMPGNCPSDFLIAATATDASDARESTGFGVVNVDVAAPGQAVPLLNLNGGPFLDSGTSYASPIVAGMVALLYSAPCSSLGLRAIADPAGTAEMVRDAIFEGVDVKPNLVDDVKTGGRVNAFNSLQFLLAQCSRCEKPFGLGATGLTGVSASLTWTSTDSTLSTNLRWRQSGQAVWAEVENVASPYFLGSLQACTEYEFQLEDLCADTSSGFSQSYVFETDGCCEAPDNVEVTMVTDNSALVSWNAVLAAQDYTLVLNSAGQSLAFDSLTNPFFQLENLSFCTGYSVQIVVHCASGDTIIGPPNGFSTLGCGACLDAEYCHSEGENAVEEWIANVNIGSLDNTSLSDGGYGDFTHLSTDLFTWESYDISLTPGYLDQPLNEYFTAWIDLDKDGDFEDVGEEVFNPGGTSQSMVVGSIFIPGTTLPGPTRMRVSMRFTVAPAPCDSLFNYGEVEDYCVNIISGLEPDCHWPEGLFVSNLTNTSARLLWDTEPDALSYELRLRPINTPQWTVIATNGTEVTVLNLAFCQTHQFQVRAVCQNGKSGWSPSTSFMTGCTNAATEEPAVFTGLEVFPNPFSDGFYVRFEQLQASQINLVLYNLMGQKIMEKTAWAGVGEQVVEVLTTGKVFAEGAYFLKIESAGGAVFRKVTFRKF